MNAVLTIDLELLEPILVTGVDHLLQLHPSQIRAVSVRLTAKDEGLESVALEANAEDNRVAIQSLVALARLAQPDGTAVQVSYQGRSERLVI